MERDGRDRPACLRRAADLSGRVQFPGRGRRQSVGRRVRPGDMSCHRDKMQEASHGQIGGRVRGLGHVGAAPLQPGARSDRGRATCSAQRLVFFFVFFTLLLCYVIMLCSYS